MIAAYVRVSSATQKTDGQRAEIERWIAGNVTDGSAVRWYEDTESGKDTNRPALKALQKAIFDGEVRTVVCFKLDRLSRDLRDGVNLLADWCEKEVRVIVTTQRLDLTGTIGRTVAALLFGLGEAERNSIRERQAAGIAVARAKGVYAGRKPGSTKARPARAAELHAKGLTVPEIANSLGTSERTIFRYLAAKQ